MITVLIADDQPSVRRALRTFLEKGYPFNCRIAGRLA